jgi:outer membrane protein OmpA-like peptidoglycan-associated protein
VPVAAVIRDTPRAGLVPVPAVLPRDGGPMRATTATTRSAKGLVAPLSTTLGKGVLRPGQAATLPGRFLFDFNSPVLTPKGHALVKALVQNVRGNKPVTCEGYTDYAATRSTSSSSAGSAQWRSAAPSRATAPRCRPLSRASRGRSR